MEAASVLRQACTLPAQIHACIHILIHTWMQPVIVRACSKENVLYSKYTHTYIHTWMQPSCHSVASNVSSTPSSKRSVRFSADVNQRIYFYNEEVAETLNKVRLSTCIRTYIQHICTCVSVCMYIKRSIQCGCQSSHISAEVFSENDVFAWYIHVRVCVCTP